MPWYFTFSMSSKEMFSSGLGFQGFEDIARVPGCPKGPRGMGGDWWGLGKKSSVCAKERIAPQALSWAKDVEPDRELPTNRACGGW